MATLSYPSTCSQAFTHSANISIFLPFTHCIHSASCSLTSPWHIRLPFPPVFPVLIGISLHLISKSSSALILELISQKQQSCLRKPIWVSALYPAADLSKLQNNFVFWDTSPCTKCGWTSPGAQNSSCSWGTGAGCWQTGQPQVSHFLRKKERLKIGIEAKARVYLATCHLRSTSKWTSSILRL